jgi:hypothetical protein
MLELLLFVIALLLAFIYLKQRKNHKEEVKKSSTNDFYFSEEGMYLHKNKIINQKTNIYFYTIAEFNEISSFNNQGLIKKLGFSDFTVVYDKNTNNFLDARVSIVATDSYDKGEKIGFYQYLNTEKDWIELNIRMSINDFNEFFNELKEAAKKRKLDKVKNYFLYEIIGSSAFKISNDDYIYFLDSFSKVGSYDSYYVDKISFMNELSNNISINSSQELIKNNIKKRLLEVNE